MKKKISLFLCFILLFVFFNSGSIINAKAEESPVIGVSNLNNTSENSAKIGDQLKLPEKGWKRYSVSNKNITFKGMVLASSKQAYQGTFLNVASTSEKEIEIKFNFIGSQLRLISTIWNDQSPEVLVYIDNIKYSYNPNIKDQSQSLIFEQKGLDYKEHSVRIYCNQYGKYVNGVWMGLDAIDIDENGKLAPYVIKPESIILNKSSITLLKGKSENLIATVKPDEATNKKVIWSSSDDTIASVDANGNVTALKVGKAIITAKVEGTDLTATCEVNVTEPNNDRAILAITMVNGITKEYDLSMDEIDAFEKWFDASNGKGQLRYGFNKTINPYKSVKEYVVFDKIASFEIRAYEVSK